MPRGHATCLAISDPEGCAPRSAVPFTHAGSQDCGSVELLRSAVREQRLQRASPAGRVRLHGFRLQARVAHRTRCAAETALNGLPPAPFTVSKGARQLCNSPWPMAWRSVSKLHACTPRHQLIAAREHRLGLICINEGTYLRMPALTWKPAARLLRTLRQHDSTFHDTAHGQVSDFPSPTNTRPQP